MHDMIDLVSFQVTGSRTVEFRNIQTDSSIQFTLLPHLALACFWGVNDCSPWKVGFRWAASCKYDDDNDDDDDG